MLLRAKGPGVVSVWGYHAFLMEVFEGVGLYLQFGYSVSGKYSLSQTRFLAFHSLYKKGPSANSFGWLGASW